MAVTPPWPSTHHSVDGRIATSTPATTPATGSIALFGTSRIDDDGEQPEQRDTERTGGRRDHAIRTSRQSAQPHRVRPHLEVRTSNRAFRMPALALQREHRRRLRMLGTVLDVIDADRFIRSRPRNERPIRLLHHHRGPTVVVAGFPNDEAAMPRVQSWSPSSVPSPKPPFSPSHPGACRPRLRGHAGDGPRWHNRRDRETDRHKARPS